MRTEDKTVSPDIHLHKSILSNVAGLGPVGLAMMNILKNAGLNPTGFADRNPDEASRKQVLGFSFEDFHEICAELFEVPDIAHLAPSAKSIDTPEWITAQELLRRFNDYLHRQLKEKSGESSAYAHITRALPIEPSNQTRPDFFRHISFTLEIKHIEQLLLLLLQKKDDSPHVLTKARKARISPTGETIKDHGPIHSIECDGTLIDHTGERHSPVLTIVSDGASSLATGLTREIDAALPDEEKLRYSETNFEPTLNPSHAVAEYNINCDETNAYLDAYLNQSTDSRTFHGELDTPTELEYRRLGWRHASSPEYRILRGKSTLYVSAEMPERISVEPDKYRRNTLIQSWHQLILRNLLPTKFLSTLYQKGTDYSKPTDTETSTARRKRRDATITTYFDVDVHKQRFLQSPIARLGESYAVVMGDAAEGAATHHHTATGLWFGFKCAIALKRALQDNDPTEENYISNVLRQYNESFTRLQAIKHELTAKYQRARQTREQHEIDRAQLDFTEILCDIESNKLEAASRRYETKQIITSIPYIVELKNDTDTLLTTFIKKRYWDLVDHCADILNANAITNPLGKLPLELAMKANAPVVTLLNLIPEDNTLLQRYRTSTGASLLDLACELDLTDLSRTLSDKGVTHTAAITPRDTTSLFTPRCHIAATAALDASPWPTTEQGATAITQRDAPSWNI